jgi:Uma2 family endonuclease
VKLEAARALGDEVAAAGLPCQVFPDGMAVRIDDGTDASVRCGPKLPEEAVQFSDPVVVVEVLSPSTRAQDTGAKLEAYFRLPSVRHYLIVNTATRSVIHHARRGRQHRHAHPRRRGWGDPPRPAGHFAPPGRWFARL